MAKYIYLLLICITNITVYIFTGNEMLHAKLLAILNQENEHNYSYMLILAAKYNFFDVVEIILEKKPSMNDYYATMDTCPLYQAVVNKGVETVQCLLAHGDIQSLDLKDENGYTVVHIAAEMGHKEIFKSLMQYKMDLVGIDDARIPVLGSLIKKKEETDDGLDIATMLLVRHAYYDQKIIKEARQKGWVRLADKLQGDKNNYAVSTCNIKTNNNGSWYSCIVQ